MTVNESREAQMATERVMVSSSSDEKYTLKWI